jgi:hypothetical protein
MHNMRLWSAAAVIAVILIVGFALSVPHLSDMGVSHPTAATPALPVVYVHDAYKKGAHTLTVKVAAPDACTVITGSANAVAADASSTPDTIAITLDMPADAGVCLQEPATTTLSLSAAAGASAKITASINGTTATTSSY